MRLAVFASLVALAACTGAAPDQSIATGNGNGSVAGDSSAPGEAFRTEVVGTFDQPWAMTFVSANTALITEKPGRLWIWHPHDGSRIAVSGVPQVDAGGQGGLGDVIAHPDFERNNLVYLSWAEAGPGNTRGAAVGRAELVIDSRGEGSAQLRNLQVIWRQSPKTEGRGHYGHRLALRDGYLFITNGDRQLFDPAQDPNQHLGKIVRLHEDGRTPADNPWAAQGGVAAQLWTMGHRNPLGLAFDAQGRLWEHEMGPQGGDEFNLIERGRNYGYPIVSNGSHYDGRDIPDHPTRPEFAAPKVWWNPSISPAGLIIYSGRLFPQWRGDALMGGLSGQALIRIDIDGTNAREANRWPMGARIREVEEGPNGEIYILEDSRNGTGGRLLRLTPAR
jgi:glucose/arabinose dehydrogenase